MTPQRIKTLRAQLGMDQTEFAALFGKKRMAVTRWETGTRTPIRADQHAMKILERVLASV